MASWSIDDGRLRIPANWFSGELIVGVGEGSRGMLHGYGHFESYKIFMIDRCPIQFERDQNEHPLQMPPRS
ncbi:hypothetical protein GOC91_19470 [Sinorhizobium medicae]|nr:hypothetical protein [Sinorhizobium medicae]MDX0881024.1 hypothetical protein [Sinorhizobium medicae]